VSTAQPGYTPTTTTAPPSKTMGVVSLVLGIVSIVSGLLIPILGVLAGIAAVVLGFLSRRREPIAAKLALGGIITGFVGIALSIAGFAFTVAFLAQTM
jgi:hypothetical protein